MMPPQARSRTLMCIPIRPEIFEQKADENLKFLHSSLAIFAPALAWA